MEGIFLQAYSFFIPLDWGQEPDPTTSDITATSTVKSNKISDIIIKRKR